MDVYKLTIGIGEEYTDKLKSFKEFEDAELYAKQQYYLYTRNYPFIADGMTSGYKSKGSRPPIDILPNTKCDIKEKNDAYEYILIMSDDYFSAHSLNPFAEWH